MDNNKCYGKLRSQKKFQMSQRFKDKYWNPLKYYKKALVNLWSCSMKSPFEVRHTTQKSQN